MVISLATSDCHSAADALTKSTVPVVIEARGTIGDKLRAVAGSCGRSLPRSTNGRCSSPFLLIDVQPSLMQHQPPCVILVHQRDVVGCDDNRGTRLVEL